MICSLYGIESLATPKSESKKYGDHPERKKGIRKAWIQRRSQEGFRKGQNKGYFKIEGVKI